MIILAARTSTLVVIVLFVGLVNGCAPSTNPPNLAYSALFCIINCPLSISVTDEGNTTDAVPIEHPYLNSENIRTVGKRK